MLEKLDCVNAEDFKPPKLVKLIKMTFSILKRFLGSLYFIMILVSAWLVRKLYLYWRSFILARHFAADELI